MELNLTYDINGNTSLSKWIYEFLIPKNQREVCWLGQIVVNIYSYPYIVALKIVPSHGLESIYDPSRIPSLGGVWKS